MRRRASFLLTAVALAQAVALGLALGFLVIKLTAIRDGVQLLGRETQSLLNQLTAAEADSFRASILLRDTLILTGAGQRSARLELIALLHRMTAEPIQAPGSLSPDLRAKLDAVNAAKAAFAGSAGTVTAWSDRERQTLGPRFLSQRLAPMREAFVANTREIGVLVRSLNESRNESIARSAGDMQILAVRILTAAIAVGLALAAIALWGMRRYERERDLHLLDMRAAEDRLRALSQRLVESQEFERKKLSRELHDEVGQTLTALRVQLGQIEPANPQSQTRLDEVAGLADRTLKTVRQMARGLRPAMLDDLGLAPALQWLGRDISKSTGLDVDVQIEGALASVDEATRTCVYRVVQEALTNCVRHSGASGARVLLHESPHEFVLTIQDRGRGFVPGQSAGIGLLGMRERVEELGGEFAVASAPGAGTLIRANLPRTTIGQA